MLTLEAIQKADKKIAAEKKRYSNQKRSLLKAIKAHIKELESLKTNFDSKYEDGLYRFYHCSFKVYSLQDLTQQASTLFSTIAKDTNLQFFNPYQQIIQSGTGTEFEEIHNQDWALHTRPIVEAFLHCKYILDMIVKYGRDLDDIPEILPSGFAAILCLYRLR